jgi:hypothetical protein
MIHTTGEIFPCCFVEIIRAALWCPDRGVG